MKTYSINLYDYFKIDKKGTKEGILECYIPNVSKEINLKREFPVMLILPGGAYAYTSDREAEPIAIKYLSLGFACYVLRYSVVPFTYPKEIEEVILALKYIKENASNDNVSKEKIAAIGFSAGGHLALMLGSLHNLPNLEMSKEERLALKPKAIVAAYPAVSHKKHNISFTNLTNNDINLMYGVSIENLIDEKTSPTFIFSTRNDGSVNVSNSLLLANALLLNKVDFSIHIYGKGPHGLSTSNDLVYNTNINLDMTKSIVGWLDLSSEWLKEQGVSLKD